MSWSGDKSCIQEQGQEQETGAVYRSQLGSVSMSWDRNRIQELGPKKEKYLLKEPEQKHEARAHEL